MQSFDSVLIRGKDLTLKKSRFLVPALPVRLLSEEQPVLVRALCRTQSCWEDYLDFSFISKKTPHSGQLKIRYGPIDFPPSASLAPNSSITMFIGSKNPPHFGQFTIT